MTLRAGKGRVATGKIDRRWEWEMARYQNLVCRLMHNKQSYHSQHSLESNFGLRYKIWIHSPTLITFAISTLYLVRLAIVMGRLC